MGDPLGGFVGVIGSRMRSSCASCAAFWGDGHVTLSGMPLRGLSGAKGFWLVRKVGRVALAAAGLLVTTLAPEEPVIAPPVGVAQAQALQIRSTKILLLPRSKELRGRLIDGGGGGERRHLIYFLE